MLCFHQSDSFPAGLLEGYIYLLPYSYISVMRLSSGHSSASQNNIYHIQAYPIKPYVMLDILLSQPHRS